MSAWLLPESVADVLPSEARRIEELRRAMLDRFRVYGYELVMPPLLEYTESLLAKADAQLDLRTFKLLDQASGRMLGLRADATPQVARIDAHILNRQGVTRLCYCGPVLHTQALGLHTTREPLQCGAELYGCSGVEADLEILSLAVDVLALSGLPSYRIALSHAALLGALVEGESLGADQLRALHSALASKDKPLLRDLLLGLPQVVQAQVLALLSLYGPFTGGADCVMVRARQVLPASLQVSRVFEELEALVAHLKASIQQPLSIHIDFSDVPSFGYHSGLIFAAYTERCPNAVLRGGRYDDVGSVYGRARPATGFSVDLRELAGLQNKVTALRQAIRAPWLMDEALMKRIRELRQAGEVVLQSLPQAAPEEEEFVCDRQLVLAADGWKVVPISTNQEK